VILPPLLSAYATLAGTLERVAGAATPVVQGFRRDVLSRRYGDHASIASVGSIAAPDPETVLSLHPDCMLAWPDTSESLRGAGLHVIDVDLSSSNLFEQATTLWDKLAALVDQRERGAATLLYALRQRDMLTASIEGRDQRPRLAFLNGFRGIGILGGRNFYLSGLIDALRARNAADELRSSTIAEPELLAKLDTDYVFIESNLGEADLDALYRSPQWQALRAVRLKRAYVMPSHNIFAPVLDEHLVLRWIAEVLYSDLSRDVREEYRATYHFLHELDLSENEIDRLLFTRENLRSLNGDRFLYRSQKE